MKHLIQKISLLILALALLLPVFAGCKNDTPADDGTSAPENTTASPDTDPAGEDPAVLIELVKAGKTDYTIARPEGASTTVKDLAMKLQSVIYRYSEKEMKVTDDFEYDKEKHEIVLGTTKYPETAEVRKRLNIAQYGVVPIDNKLVIYGYTETALEKAVNAFEALLKKSIKVEDDKTVTLAFSSKDAPVNNMLYYFGDIPEFTAGSFYDSYDLANENVQLLYKNVKADDFRNYVKTLAANGFKEYQQYQISDNLFATYTAEGGVVYLEYLAYNQTLSIITDSLATNSLVTPETYDPAAKVTENTLGIFSLDYSHRDVTDGNGMGYVITLEDGRYVIIDGGYTYDAENLYQYLKDNNKRTDGIKIAAWFISHSHGDHYGCIEKFAPVHGRDVTLEYVIANPDSVSRNKSATGYNGYLANSVRSSIVPCFGGSPKFVKTHTGQVYTFGNVVFEVMYTHENLYPTLIPNQNEACTVLRMRANGKSVLFTADTEYESVTTMMNMYGSALKSDILQINHHGYSGGSKEFFDLVNPSVAMWTTSQAAFDIRIKSSYPRGYNKYAVDKVGLANTFVADGDCKLLPMNYTSLSEVTYYSFKK